MNEALSLLKEPQTRRAHRPMTRLLLYSKALVESIEFAATGVVSYAKGDLMEIAISSSRHFELGEAVKITLYSPLKICTFYSTVIVRSEGSLLLIHPHGNRRKLGDMREHPRVRLNRRGCLHAVIAALSDQNKELPRSMPCRITDISAGGVGLIVAREEKIQKNSCAILELALDFQLRCAVEIVRIKQGTAGFRCGAIFRGMPEHVLFSLKSFVLKQQIEQYCTYKKKMFEDFAPPALPWIKTANY